LQDVIAIHGKAKKIGGNKAGLRRLEADHADHNAVGCGDDPALPLFSPDEKRGKHRKDAGKIIKPQHKSP